MHYYLYMPLYSMKEILDDAMEKKYGVGYYNCVNTEMAKACIRAAEDTRAPIIIGTAESLLKYCGFEWLSPILLDAARNAKVPVAVHLDHAYRFDSIMKALRWGFGSVMFDGSLLPPEENIAASREIAKVSHAMGAELECELGKVGGLEEGGGVIGKNVLTEVGDAVDFVEKTETDFLAVSIGTTHGAYKEAPALDFDRLAEIRKNVGIALVLHGGSGLSKDDYRKCIAGGMQKINIYTDVVTAAMSTIRENAETTDYLDLLEKTVDAMYSVVVDNINTFGSNNRA
jgi:fructose-bisphosphate aldolase class II